jgi:hypothetical protein
MEEKNTGCGLSDFGGAGMAHGGRVTGKREKVERLLRFFLFLSLLVFLSVHGDSQHPTPNIQHPTLKFHTHARSGDQSSKF